MEKNILKRLGHYLLMDEEEQKKFKKMLNRMLREDITTVVKVEEINIKKRKEENSKLLEIMIKEQLREIKKNEDLQN